MALKLGEREGCGCGNLGRGWGMAQELVEREECGCWNWRRGAITGFFPPCPCGDALQEGKGKGRVPWDSSKQIPEGASVCSPEAQGEGRG